MSKRSWLWGLVVAMAFTGAYLMLSAPPSPSISISSNSLNKNATDSASAVPANVSIIPAALTKEGVPAMLGALSLRQTEAGPNALAEFAQLHGKAFDLIDGYRADYAAGDRQATLWVGQAKDAASAQAMLDAMAQKIGPSNGMFQNLQALDINGRTIYVAAGQGQQHFFCAVNDKIVWLAANADQAADVLHSLWSAVK